MKTIFFFIIIALVMFALVWATRKFKADTDLAKPGTSRDTGTSERADFPAPPPDYVQPRSDVDWHTRRHEAAAGHNHTGHLKYRHVPKSKRAEEDSDAKGLTMTSIEFKPMEHG